MNDLKRFGSYALVLIITALFVVGAIRFLGPKIGNTFSTISSCLDCPSQAISTSIVVPTFVSQLPLTGPDEPLKAIDEALKNSIGANIAYNAPAEMEVGETVTIELLLNPSLTEPELVKEVSEPGVIYSGNIEITPQMKAEIILPTKDALLVTPLHDNAIQFVSSVETTKWSWFVTAQKAGSQRLTIVVYRLVKVDGEESWREVETYKSNIDVKVTLASQIKSLDWKWIIGIIVTALLIPGFWRWADARRKKNEAEKTDTKKPSTSKSTRKKKS